MGGLASQVVGICECGLDEMLGRASSARAVGWLVVYYARWIRGLLYVCDETGEISLWCRYSAAFGSGGEARENSTMSRERGLMNCA
jgi:hypothetical protein